MKIRKTRTGLAILLTVAILMNSCNKDQITTVPNEPTAARFATAPDLKLRTNPVEGDSSATGWQAEDKIGIFMLKADGEFIPANIIGDQNLAHQATPDPVDSRKASFSAVGASHYYPQEGDDVNFVAYYPYQEPLDLTAITLNVSDQTDAHSQSLYDLLYAADQQPYNKTSGTVALSFNHVLSKMVIHLAPEDGGGLTTEDLVGIQVTISGLINSGAMNIVQSQGSILGLVGDISPLTGADGTRCQAIIIPQQAAALSLKFTLADNATTQAHGVAGNSFTWTAPTTNNFVAANQYIYNMKLTRNEASGTGTIVDWRINTIDDGIAD